MIDGRNVFDQPKNSMTKTYENIRRTATGHGDDIKLVVCYIILYSKKVTN